MYRAWFQPDLLSAAAWAFSPVAGLPPAVLIGLYGKQYMVRHLRLIGITTALGTAVGASLGVGLGLRLRTDPPQTPYPAGCPRLETVTPVGEGGSDCYGVIGLDGIASGDVFGLDKNQDGAAVWQRRILAANSTALPGEPTIIWVGELSCMHYDDDASRCRSGGDVFDHDSEIDELKALRMAQATWHVRVVLADAGEHDDHIEQLAGLLVQLDGQGRFGARRVVVGGGNSKTHTRNAIQNDLLPAGIPVIAPSLAADDTAPGRPFVPQAGYLQLSPPIDVYAKSIVDGLTRTFPGGVHLVIYQQSDPNDLYKESLRTDVTTRVNTLATGPAALKIDVDTVQPGRLGQRICQPVAGHASPDRPTAVLFADRYYRYYTFVDEVTRLCHGRPTLVLTDSSANKLLSGGRNIHLPGDWPTFYFSAGQQCYDLDPARARQLIAALALPIAGGGLGIDCSRGHGQIGDHVAPFWDAVLLAREILPDRRIGHDDLPSLHLPGLPTSQSPLVTVVDGQIDPAQSRPIPLIGLCVAHVDRKETRSAALCDDPQHQLAPDRRHFFVIPPAS